MIALDAATLLLICLLATPTLAETNVYAVHDTPEPMEALLSSLAKLGIHVALEDQKLVLTTHVFDSTARDRHVNSQ